MILMSAVALAAVVLVISPAAWTRRQVVESQAVPRRRALPPSHQGCALTACRVRHHRGGRRDCAGGSPSGPGGAGRHTVFFQQLGLQGIVITDPAEAIASAHAVCTELSQGHTDADLVSEALKANTPLTIASAEGFIGSAVAAYCRSRRASSGITRWTRVPDLLLIAAALVVNFAWHVRVWGRRRRDHAGQVAGPPR